MNSAISSAAGTRRPRVGVALIAALVVGGLVAGGAYAQRAGAFSLSDPGLTQSAAMRAQLASAVTPAARAKGGSGLLAWRAPKVPKVKPAAPRVITPPPQVITTYTTAPAPAPAPQQAAAAAPAPAPAPAPTTGHEDDNGGGGGDD
jgi:hypothetical protein